MLVGWCAGLVSRCEDSTGVAGIWVGDWGWVFVFMGLGVWPDMSSSISRRVREVADVRPGWFAA